MEQTFVFAILPLGLLWSLVERQRRGMVGIAPLITALLPVAAGAVQSLIARRSQNQQGSAAQREAERQAGFQQKSEFYSPQAVAQRQQNQALSTIQLGRLAGAMGGLDRVPPALRNMLQQRRQAQTFQFEPGAVARQPRAPGNFGTDILGNLQHFDVEAYRRGRAPATPTTPTR